MVLRFYSFVSPLEVLAVLSVEAKLDSRNESFCTLPVLIPYFRHLYSTTIKRNMSYLEYLYLKLFALLTFMNYEYIVETGILKTHFNWKQDRPRAFSSRENLVPDMRESTFPERVLPWHCIETAYCFTKGNYLRSLKVNRIPDRVVIS